MDQSNYGSLPFSEALLLLGLGVGSQDGVLNGLRSPEGVSYELTLSLLPILQ